MTLPPQLHSGKTTPLLAPALFSCQKMLLSATALMAVAAALWLPATAVVVELDPMPERPYPEPVFMGNMRSSDVYSPRYRRNIESPLSMQEDPYDFWKRTTNPYFRDHEWNNPPPSKRSVDLDLESVGESESMEDAHMPEKRMYIFRDGFRPSKRSMAIGRAGMRPGKRASASIYRGKRGQMLPESYLPQNRFLFLED